MVAAPLLGYAFARKKRRSSNGEAPASASTSRGIIASAWAGYKLFRKLKPAWDQLRSWRS
jgi:hypothetical protein